MAASVDETGISNNQLGITRNDEAANTSVQDKELKVTTSLGNSLKYILFSCSLHLAKDPMTDLHFFHTNISK